MMPMIMTNKRKKTVENIFMLQLYGVFRFVRNFIPTKKPLLQRLFRVYLNPDRFFLTCQG